MATIGSLLVDFRANVATLTRDMERGFGSIRKQSRQIKNLGKDFTAGLTLPIVGIGIAATKMATDLNSSMANVATLIPNSTERILELKRAVQDTAIATGTSTADMAEGLFQLVSAFGDSAESAELLRLNAIGAKAGLTSVTDSINLTSAVTKGYGDTSLEANQRALDLAFTTNKLGQTTFPELAASIGRVVPLASALAISQEELFGVMATATGVTGNAAEVSTQLRGVLQSLMAPTSSMTELFDAMGVSSGEALIQQEGFAGTLQAIVAAAESAGEPLQKFIGSIEGQTLALALTGSQAQALIDKTEAMGASSGALIEAFGEQTSGINALGFGWDQMKQQMAVAAQLIGDSLAPVLSTLLDNLRPLIDFVIGLVGHFSTLSPAIQGTAIAVLAAVAAIGPLLLVAGTLIPALLGIGPAVLAVIAILTGPVGIVIAIGTVVAILGGFLLKNKAVRDGLKTVWAVVKTNLGTVLDSIKRLFETVSAAFKSIWDKWGNSIKSLFKGIWSQVSGILGPALKGISGILSGGLKVLTGLVEVFAGVLTGDWSLMAEGIKTIWSGLWTAIKAAVTAPFEAIKNVVKGFVDGVEGLWTPMADGIKSLWSGLWTAIKAAVTAPFEAINTVVSGFTSGITGFFQGMFDAVVGKSIVPAMMSGIKTEFGRLGSEVQPAVATDLGALKGEFKTFSTDLVGTGGIIPGMVGEIESQFSNIAKGFSTGVADMIFEGKNLKDTMIGIFKDIGKAIVSSLIEDLINKGLGVIKDFASGIGGIFKGGGAVGGAASGGGGIPTASFTKLAITGVAIQTGIFGTGVAITGVTIQKGEFKTGVSITGLSLGFGGGGSNKDVAFNTRLTLAWIKDFFPVFNASNDRMEGALNTIRDHSKGIRWWAEHHGARLQNISDKMNDLIPIQRDRIAPAVEGIRSRLETTLNVSISQPITVNVSSGSAKVIGEAVGSRVASANREFAEMLKKVIRTNEFGARTVLQKI